MPAGGRRRETVEATPPKVGTIPRRFEVDNPLLTSPYGKSKWPETALPRSVPGTPPEELDLEFTPPACDAEPQPMVEEEPGIDDQSQPESEPSQPEPVAVVDLPPSPPPGLPSIKITPTAVSPGPSRPESPVEEEDEEEDEGYQDDLVDHFSDGFAEKPKDEELMERLPSVTEEEEEDEEEEGVETGQTTEESRPVMATDDAVVIKPLSLNQESGMDTTRSDETDDKANIGAEESELANESAQYFTATPEPGLELVATTTPVPNLEIERDPSPTNELEDNIKTEESTIEEILKPEFPIETVAKPVESGEIQVKTLAPPAAEEEPTVERTLDESEEHPAEGSKQKLEPLPEIPSAMATGPTEQPGPVEPVSILELSAFETTPSIDEISLAIDNEVPAAAKVEFQPVQPLEAEGNSDLRTDALVEEKDLDGPAVKVEEIESCLGAQSPVQQSPDDPEVVRAVPPAEDLHDESHGLAETEVPILSQPLAPPPSFCATDLDALLNKLNGEGTNMGRPLGITTTSETESPPHRPIFAMSSPPPKRSRAFPDGDEGPSSSDSEPSSRSSSADSGGRPWTPIRRRSTPDPDARWSASNPGENVPKLVLAAPTPRCSYDPSEAFRKFWDHTVAVAAAAAEGRDPPPPPSPPKRIRPRESELEAEREKYAKRVLRRGLRGRSLSAHGGKDLTFEEQEEIRDDKARQEEKEAMPPPISEAKASVNKVEDVPQQDVLTEEGQSVGGGESFATEDVPTVAQEDTETDIPTIIQEQMEADISSVGQEDTVAETISSLPPALEVKHEEAEPETAADLNPQDSEEEDTTPLITPEPTTPSLPAPSSSSSTFSWKTPLLITVCAIFGLLLTLPSLSSHTLHSLTTTSDTDASPSTSIATLDKMRASITTSTSKRESVCSVTTFMPARETVCSVTTFMSARTTVGFSMLAPTRVEAGAPTLTLTAAAAMEEGRSSW
jgi:hypothetical protein